MPAADEPLVPLTAKALALAALACLATGLLWSLDATTSERAAEETIVRDAWLERAAFSYEPRGPDGAPLPSGEPGYLVDEAPGLHVGFTWQLDDPRAERVAGVGSLALIVEHAERPAWRHEERLGEAALSGAPTEPLALSGLLDLAGVADRIEATPGRDARDATWRVVAEIRFASTPDVTHADDASTFEMPLAWSPPLYTLPPEHALDVTKDHTEREVVTHVERAGLEGLAARPAGPILVIGGALLLARTGGALLRDDEVPA